MSEEGNNYTPLDIAKLPPKKKSFSLSNKMLFSLIVFLTIGVGMVGYLLVLRRPIRKAVPAYLSGEASACDVKLGPPISGSEKVEGNKYSIQVPLENKSDNKKRVKLSSGWFACPLNDQQTCTANAHKEDKELLLGKKEQKIITVTAEQPEGACGSLQIDLKLKAVKKADDDDDKDGEKKDGEAKEGEVRVESDGGGWDESCNTNSTWVGGFYAFPQACGVPPTDTPPPSTPTPTGVEPTSTPTPTDDDDNRTPTPTRTPTPSLTPTGSPGPTLTPTPTSTPGDGTPTPTPTPKPTSTPSLSNTPGPSPTPIPVACGTKSCDNTTNPCRSGLICLQANDGSNYCSLPEFQNACKANPSQTSCCTAPDSTPTEIVLVNATSTPGPGVTTAAQVTEIPPAGIATFGRIFTVVSLAVILLGLIL